MAELLSDDEIEARLSALEGWSRDGDAITKAFDNERLRRLGRVRPPRR